MVDQVEQIRLCLKDEPDLPQLPMVIVQVQEALEDASSSAKDLAGLILEDQVLTAKVLRLANSVYYNHSGRKIKTVTEAIVILGFETIQTITLGLSVYKLLSGLAKEQQFKQFWKHSLCAGVCARAFAKEVQYARPEEAFISGLLHDIGKVVLYHYYKEKYLQAVKLEEEDGMVSHEAEYRILGIDHLQAGNILAQHWNLPEYLRCQIRYHHDPNPPIKDKEKPSLHDLVVVADEVSKNIFGTEIMRQHVPMSRILNRVNQRLGIKQERFFEIATRLGEDVYHMSRLLDLKIEGAKIEPFKADAKKVQDEVGVDDALARKEAEVNFFLEVNQQLVSVNKIEEVLDYIFRGIFDLMQCQRVLFLFENPKGTFIEGKLGYGGNSRKVAERISIPTNNEADVVVRAFASQEPFNFTVKEEVQKVQVDQQVLFNALSNHKVAGVPIVIDGKSKALLVVERDPGVVNTEEDMVFLKAVSNYISISIQKSRLGNRSRG